MTKDNIKDLMNLLGMERIHERGDWISSSCPLSEFKHEKGSDTHPSFGIKEGDISWCNCFTCGFSTPLTMLPNALTHYTKKDYTKIREFIAKNEGWFATGPKEVKSLRPMSEVQLLRFFDYEPKDLITKEIIDEWNLKFDIVENRLLIPIRNYDGRLVGIRGRSMGLDGIQLRWRVYKEINPESADAKYSGVWLGCHFDLRPTDRLILVEGDRDAIFLRAAGYQVWSSMGATLAKKQIEEIKKLSNEIVIFMDNDLAGINASNQLYKELHGLMPLYKIVDYCGCKDPAELYEKGLLNKALASIVKLS